MKLNPATRLRAGFHPRRGISLMRSITSFVRKRNSIYGGIRNNVLCPPKRNDVDLDGQTMLYSQGYKQKKSKSNDLQKHLLPLTFYFPKNPECNLGKRKEVRGNK